MPWDSDLYLRFREERTRPALELASRVAVAEPRSVADLGCGPGNSTQVLRRRWPDASITGVDNSTDMIAAAKRAYPDQDWLDCDIDAWSPDEPVDVVFSNAALQWLGDHQSLVRRLFGWVAPGGALAFQIPSDAYSPVRRFIHEIADDPLWSSRMWRAKGTLTMEQPAFYYDALAGYARGLDLWETEYFHILDGPDAVVQWISSTGLRPFLEPLNTAERRRFTTRLRARVAGGYARRIDGRVLFPFRRLFAIAYA